METHGEFISGWISPYYLTLTAVFIIILLIGAVIYIRTTLTVYTGTISSLTAVYTLDITRLRLHRFVIGVTICFCT